MVDFDIYSILFHSAEDSDQNGNIPRDKEGTDPPSGQKRKHDEVELVPVLGQEEEEEEKEQAPAESFDQAFDQVSTVYSV